MENYYSIEFRLERERRYLLKNPFQAIALALNYLEDFLNLAREFRTLEQKNQTLEQKYKSVMADNQRLTSQLIKMSSSNGDLEYLSQKRSNSHIRVRIPLFLDSQRH